MRMKTIGSVICLSLWVLVGCSRNGAQEGKQGPSSSPSQVETAQIEKWVTTIRQEPYTPEGRQASEALKGRGNEAIPVILREMHKGGISYDTAITFAGILTDVGEKSVVKDLVPLLKSPEKNVREGVLSAIQSLGGDASLTPVLISALTDPDPSTRSRAISALGDIRDARAVPSLITIVQDKNESPGFRQYAARALGKIGSPEAIPALSALTEESDKTLRMVTYEALGRIKNKAVIPVLIHALRTEDSPMEFGMGILHALHCLTGKRFTDFTGWIGSSAGFESEEEQQQVYDSMVQEFNESRGWIAEQWEQWWTENHATFEFPSKSPCLNR